MALHGHVHWTELNTHDPEAAKAFYGAALGWTFTASEMPDGTVYTLIWSGDEMVGGIFHMNHPAFDGIPEHWFTYFAVDDLDARLASVTSAGGQITRPPFSVPGTGRMAVIQAASGSFCALMQPEASG